MRLFVAVVPPPRVREAALETAHRLSWEGRIRWTPPQNVHLTLKFLGETPEAEVPALERALQKVSRGHEAFDCTLEGVGAFSSLKRARTLWVGVGKGAQRLSELAEDVEAGLEELGFAREKRPFHPHATVGRAKGGGAALVGSEDSDTSPSGFRVESIELVSSRLSEAGAVYSTLAAPPLGSDGDT